MASKSNSRSWNDVQIAIATTAIVATLGLWNLFSTPVKTVTAKVEEPIIPPLPTEEPPAVANEPVVMPQVKIMFTQVAPQPSVVVQPQKVKKKNNGGGGTVTNTQTS